MQRCPMTLATSEPCPMTLALFFTTMEQKLMIDLSRNISKTNRKIPGLANVDFADVRTIMANAGSSLMGIGTATGKTRARDAALNAIQSPLLDLGIERATGIVWNITGGSHLTLFKVNTAAEVIYDLVDPTANLIFGAVIDPSISGQAGRLAQGDTGLGNNRQPSFNEGNSFDIPEFLKKKGRSRYPRA
ncbi:hypothetical protein GOBAR_AA11054 [Gossypium barbadense]|uniref:Tubulin/FtsZ 2-layer sandwich domain-containing protein n=1 Tax=Gossypium barbadense TaxID=3634 RepID=A0A2P5Y1Y4_GOSBA|nr:hypothetical protein GOBAR_AA11054 [Gossypium barbadense]